MVQSRLNPLFAASALLALAAIAGCGSAQLSTNPSASSENTAAPVTAPQNKIRVVATFLPMYLFTKAVAGEAAQVEILIPPGTEVHEYQSTPANVKTLSQADILVQNGLGIEEFLQATVKNAGNANLKIIDASKGITPITGAGTVVSGAKGAESDHAHADETAHSHEGGNPHVWLDPVLAKQQVAAIRDGLIAADPRNRDTYQANAAAYIQKLDGLNREFEQRLAKLPDRTFVTFHDAFPYLARRYRLQQVAVVEIPEDQLSPADVQQTVSTVQKFKVKALLSEPGVDNKLLNSLAKDLNVTLRPLDSLENGQLDPDYYFTAMRANLQTLETAFR